MVTFFFTSRVFPLASILFIFFSMPACNLYAQCPTGNVVFVRSNAPAGGNGQSWATAYNTLQAAVNAGATCTTQKQIWVAKGTYYPTEKPWGATSTDNRDFAFYLRNNLAVYGGFDGTETTLAGRNVATNPTILSGDIGIAGNSTDNCYHVLVNVFNNTTTVLNGFTVTGGNASGIGTLSFTIGTSGYILDRSNGGGVYNLANAQLLLVNLAIVNNNATDFGGGMYNINASPAITNVVFYANTANFGGGMLNEAANPVVTNAIFHSNNAVSNGSAIRNFNAVATIRNTIIWGNTGSGIQSIYSSNGSDTTKVFNCIVQGNPVYNGTNNNNTNTNPLWLNASLPAGADGNWITADDGLQLTCGSPAINTATTEGGNAARDILGISRPQGIAYDKGSYEYIATPPVVSITANTDFPACPATTVTFTATGTDVGVSPIYRWYVNNIAVGNNSSLLTYPALAQRDVVYVTLNSGCATGTSNAIAVSFLAAGKKIYVDNSVATPGNGSSWGNAFRELRDALPAVMHCNTVDTILVAKGTYKPAIGTSLDSTFLITRGKLKIYGGFPSGGGTRNPALNPTILSGDLGQPWDSYDYDNSLHIMVVAGIINTADSLVLDGFTFTYSSFNIFGTGIYNGVAIANRGALVVAANDMNMPVAVRNCTFSDNGNVGMYNRTSRLSISDCRFTRYFSGIINDTCSVVMSRCLFSDNSAVSYGPGVMYSKASSLQVNDCSFTGNNFSSAAVYNDHCTGSFSKCRFDSNGSSNNGMGGVHNRYSTMRYTNCIIANNISSTNAGGMVNFDSTTVLTNCIFYANKCLGNNYPGAIRSVGANARTVATNCTFFDNQGGSASITSGESAGTISFANCILWGNTSNTVMFASNTYNSITATYTIVQGGYSGAGNLNMYPGFVDTTNHNLDLQACSPAINKGIVDYIPDGVVIDIAGRARIFNGFVDIGAYESVELPSVFTFKGNGSWNEVDNWQCNWVPPSPLPAGKKIFINPLNGGSCILNQPYTVSPGAELRVMPGANLVVPSLKIQ